MLRIFAALLAGLLLCAQTPMLPGFPPGTFQNRAALDASTALPGPPTVTFIKTIGLSTGSTSFSQSVNVHVAPADELLVMTFTCIGTATISSPVIGGISGTVVQTDSANLSVSILQFLIPNGTDLTAATLTFTLSATLFDSSVAGFFYIPQSGLSSTTKVDSKSTGSAGATAISITTLATSAGSAVIAVAGNADAASTTTWSGTESYTEDYDQIANAMANTGAHATGAAASGGSTVTATFTNSAASRISAASWR